jgi:hypothetical protein
MSKVCEEIKLLLHEGQTVYVEYLNPDSDGYWPYATCPLRLVPIGGGGYRRYFRNERNNDWVQLMCLEEGIIDLMDPDRHPVRFLNEDEAIAAAGEPCPKCGGSGVVPVGYSSRPLPGESCDGCGGSGERARTA